jgi:hypothetical protein
MGAQPVPSPLFTSGRTLTPDPLASTRAAISARETKRVNIGMLGASLTEGYPCATGKTTEDYLAAKLRASFPTSGTPTGLGYLGHHLSYSPGTFSYVGGTLDDTIGFGGTHTTWYSTVAAGGYMYALVPAGTSAWTSFDINFFGTAGGSATGGKYSVDGAAYVNFSNLSGTTVLNKLHVATAVTSYVLIVPNGGTDNLIVNGVTAYSGDENKGIQVHNFGHAAYTVAQWMAGWGGTPNWMDDIIGMDLDLLIMQDLGVNDAFTGGGNLTAAQFKAQLASFIEYIRARGFTKPIMLCAAQDESNSIAFAEPWANYVAAIREVADWKGLAFANMGDNVPGPPGSLYYTDNIHGATDGSLYNAMATVLYNNIVASGTFTETKTSSGSWTCPANVFNVTVECEGAGGGGGFGAGLGNSGSGAGGGAYASSVVPVVPGTVYSYVVGAAGVGGTSATINGTAGGDSTFNTSTVVAKGGSGGPSANAPGVAQGGQAASCTGTIKTSGGNGVAGVAFGNGGAGGAGAAPLGGAGGATGSASAPGNPGVAPGGGGGGAIAGTFNGGAGSIGRVVFTYSASTIGGGNLTLGGTSAAKAPASATAALSLGAAAVASFTASGTITLGAAAALPTSASASITLTGNAAAAGAANATGNLDLSGGVNAAGAATATGTITFGGAATPSFTATGLITLSGSATGKAPVTASGSITLGAAAVASFTATALITLSGSATPSFVANGSVTLSASGTGQAPATATALITLAATQGITAQANIVLMASATPSPSAVTGTASITLSAAVNAKAAAGATAALSLSAATAALASAVANGSITLGATAAPKGAAVASALLTLLASAVAKGATSATASIDLAASGNAGAPASATASLTLSGNLLIVSTGGALIVLNGSATAIVVTLRDITVIALTLPDRWVAEMVNAKKYQAHTPLDSRWEAR